MAVINSDPAAWMEMNFYVPDPRDPGTGEQFEAGPIVLSDHQKRILRAALTRRNGLFPYVTIVYSAVKKSGKTRLAAGVAAWYAATAGAYNEIYCLANDGKQSTDRILSAIKQAVLLNPKLNWNVTKTRITLPNGTFIEAIPCDPRGQAGSNPGLTVWSEMWGFKHEHKERLWSEMTIPPTRWGKAFRFVESYAGYSDESTTLLNLYELGTKNSKRHPAFPDIPVYINDPAKLFCYWDHEPRMPWQTDEYYAQEATMLTPDEFRRIHRNEWVSSTEKAIWPEWWEACNALKQDGVRLPPLDKRTPAVLGVDASVSHDCCAATIVTRHPGRPKEIAIRRSRAWLPPKGGKIDLTETLEKYIRWAVSEYNIILITYDEYQLHKMMTDLRVEGLGPRFEVFSQGADRMVADKQFLEMVLQRQITHDGDPTLADHVDNAAIKKSEDTKLRFVKSNQDKPIDALVAASMASFIHLRFQLT